MIKNWNPDLFVILGDFDYVNNPTSWNSMLDSVLGEDFPLLAVAGNHDVPRWSNYQQYIASHMKSSGLDQYCTGTIGVDMVCNYKGLFFVLNAVGTMGSINSYVNSATLALEANKHLPYKFCGWHKNQHIYQTGDKEDETGFAILDVCRQYGAVVCTGHEHSYSRTVLMSNFAQGTYVQPKQANTMQLSNGESFLFVSGLGGKSIRDWQNNAQNNPWWAKCASSNNGVNYGALLCTITNTSGTCQQTDITGKIWDTFTFYPPQNTLQKDDPICQVPYYELGVSEDVHEDTTGNLVTNANVVDLTDQTTAFRFEKVPLSATDRIRTAHLQLYGVESAPGRVVVVVKAERVPHSSSLDIAAGAVSMRPTTETTIQWAVHDGDVEWEEGEVWVSPNIAPLLEEVRALPGWKEGNAVTLVVNGTGSARRVYTRDRGDCFAPTLAIELESDC